MKTYWFVDNESGEEFFVEAATLADAYDIAETYFSDPDLIDANVTPMQAEAMGLDTYT